MKEITGDLINSLAPERSEQGHKGTFGTALLVAGSKYMTGALTLAADSCLRSGVGMVRVFSEDDALLPVKINCPCALTTCYESSEAATLRKLIGVLPGIKSCGIGSGLDVKDTRNKSLLAYLITNVLNLVIDASALTIISNDKEYFYPLLKNRTTPAILTPHVGELKRLASVSAKEVLSNEELLSICSQISKDTNTVIILKSSISYICDRGNIVYYIEGNNSGMAKGGSGDVLMGLITGLCAQGMSAVDATVSGAYIHSIAGKYAATDLGVRAMLPVDLVTYFPDVFDEIGW